MKKNQLLILLCMLLGSINMAMGQAPTAAAPDIFNDINAFPAGTTTVYYKPGDTYANIFKSTTVTANTVFADFQTTCFQAYNSTTSWASVGTAQSKILSTTTREKYIYVVYAGEGFNKLMFMDDGATYTSRNVEDVQTYNLANGWKLGRGTIPDTYTGFKRLIIQLKETPKVVYVGGLAVSSYEYVVPAPDPDPDAPGLSTQPTNTEGFLPIYSGVDGLGNRALTYGNAGYGTGNSSASEAYPSSANEECRKFTLTTPASSGAGANRLTFTAPQPSLSTANYDYTRVRIDYYIQSSTGSSNKLRFAFDAANPVTTSSYLYYEPSDLSTGEWHTMDIPLTALKTSGNELLANIVAGMKSMRVMNIPNGTAGTMTVYLDNIYFYIPTEPNDAPTDNGSSQTDVVPIYGQHITGGGLSTKASGFTAADYTDPTDLNVSKKVVLTSGVTGANTITIPLAANQTNMLVVNGKTANAVRMNVWVSPTVTPTLKIRLNGTGTPYEIPTALTPGEWNTISIPLNKFSVTTNLSRIDFVGSGTVYIDNLFFYYEDGNLEPVCQVGGTEYMSIYAAYEDHKNDTGAVKIELFRDSREANRITMTGGSYTSLTICPISTATAPLKITFTGATTEDETQGGFIYLHKERSGSVIIDGRKGGVSGGTPHYLVMVGKPASLYMIGFSSGDATVPTTNLTVRDCKFTTASGELRPSAAIRGSGKNVLITGNYFENCLANWGDQTKNVVGTSVINIAPQKAISGVEISDNHFYETEQITFTGDPISHSFIKILYNAINEATPFKIVNNKMGGSAPGATGTMTVRHPAGKTHGAIQPIDIKSTWPNSAIAVDATTTAYVLIQGNEIANIDIENNGYGIYQLNGASNELVEDYFANFTGITGTDGVMLIKGNKIHDIRLRALAHPTKDTQRYLFVGVYNPISGGIGRSVIEENEISAIDVDFMANTTKSVIIAGIMSQISNSNSANASTVAATIRDNKVIMGHAGTKTTNQYTDIRCLSARISNISANANNQARMDVYNNTLVFNEFKLTTGTTDGKPLMSASPIDLMNSARTDNGVINCYNNIAVVQPKVSGSFSGIITPISGINCVSNNYDGVYNVFNNTVFIASGVDGSPAAVTYDIRTAGKGTLNFWNNNLVNLNDNGTIYNCTPNSPKKIYFDYNNYYIPSAGNMVKQYSPFNTTVTYFKTFDNWKFSNTLTYLGKTAEHDHHSRFLYPCFNSTVAPANLTIPVVTLSNIGNLKTLLVPKRFIAGKKVDPTGLKTLTTNVNATTKVATVTSANMTALPDMKSAARRLELPTVGALNTNFTNYWTGTAFANATPSSASTTPWLQDLVFGPTATANYTLSAALSVHDIYNDTSRQLNLNGQQLTVTGYIGLEGSGKSTINANGVASTIVYAGADGHTVDSRKGAAAQHIFKQTFVSNQVNNLHLNNNSQYFVLLHGDLTTEPGTTPTLTILNDFAVRNATSTAVSTTITYPGAPAHLLTGKHLGGLNCNWYKTTLAFAGTLTGRTPNLGAVQAWQSATPYTYRPHIGQRIPRHGIFNNEVYNLVSSSKKVITYHDELYVRKDLTISATGNAFEVSADKFTRVEGQTTNNGGVAGLIIKSREIASTDETALNAHLYVNRPRLNASFVYNNNSATSAVNATVEMYSPAQLVGSNYRWQFFTLPVDEVNNNSYFTWKADNKMWVRRWDPKPTNGNPYWGTPYWLYIEDGDKVTSRAGYSFLNTSGGVNTSYNMHGYEITMDKPAKFSYTGKLTNQSLSTTLAWNVYNENTLVDKGDYDWSSEQKGREGQYVFGNPYTAGLDISKLEFGSNLDPTVFIYTTGSYADWDGATGTGKSAGQYLAVPKNLAGVANLDRYLSSMQGFVVRMKTNSASNNTFTAPYAAVTNPTVGKNTVQQRSTNNDEPAYTIVDLRSGNHGDRLWMVLNPDCSKGYNAGWDGAKFVNVSSPVQLFTIEEESDGKEKQYQVTTMDDFNGTYLGIVANSEDTEYTLTFNHSNDEAAYDRLYLIDLKDGREIDITESGSSYTFTLDAKDEIRKRFRIGSSTNGETAIDDVNNNLGIYANGQQVVIENLSEAAQLFLYDVSGKLIQQASLTDQARQTITTSLAKGSYLVQIVGADGQIFGKKQIILQ